MKKRIANGLIRATANGCVALVVLFFAGCAVRSAEWPQWGGPSRDFMVASQGLADQWPEGGPKRLWHRELGDGYATVVADDGLLYTMYRIDQTEFTVALDADTGKTVWEYKNASPFTALMAQFGPGPHSTPQVVGNRLYTIGTNAVLHCFNKKNGKVLWKHDLAKEFGAPIPGRGYGCSPIAYKNMLVVSVDREREEQHEGESSSSDSEAETKTDEQVDGQALIAFDQKDGSVIWKSLDYRSHYASPILIDFEGETQLVFLMVEDIVGLDPETGQQLWHHTIEPRGANMATPVFNGKDLIFCSSAYNSGSRVIKLTRKDGKTVPEQLWYSRKMRVHHGTVINVGDCVYGSSGDFGPAFYMGMNLNTGKVVWRKRGFKKANSVYADGKMIILDEDGDLALATVTPDGFTVRSRCKVAEPTAWAAPTVVGTKLYVRDRKHIMAFDLS